MTINEEDFQWSRLIREKDEKLRELRDRDPHWHCEVVEVARLLGLGPTALAGVRQAVSDLLKERDMLRGSIATAQDGAALEQLAQAKQRADAYQEIANQAVMERDNAEARGRANVLLESRRAVADLKRLVDSATELWQQGDELRDRLKAETRRADKATEECIELRRQRDALIAGLPMQ